MDGARTLRRGVVLLALLATAPARAQTVLDSSAGALRRDFEADAGKTRLLFLLSPS